MSTQRIGLLFVVSGPSGVGKTTTVNEAIRQGLGAKRGVTMTTRPQRDGETHGVDYKFILRPFFEHIRSQGLFLESTEYNGHLYGTEESDVVVNRCYGRDMVLILDPTGALAVRRRYPDAVLIFIAPQSMGEVRRRLEGRGGDPETIEARLKMAESELAFAPEYDYVIPSRDIKHDVNALTAIVAAQRMRCQ